MPDKDTVEREIRGQLEDRLNTDLAQRQLLETRDVVKAAMDLDAELISLNERAKEKVWSREEWRQERAALAVRVDHYQALARSTLRMSPLSADESGGKLWATRLPGR